jgi:hypothetical protein
MAMGRRQSRRSTPKDTVMHKTSAFWAIAGLAAILAHVTTFALVIA